LAQHQQQQQQQQQQGWLAALQSPSCYRIPGAAAAPVNPTHHAAVTVGVTPHGVVGVEGAPGASATAGGYGAGPNCYSFSPVTGFAAAQATPWGAAMYNHPQQQLQQPQQHAMAPQILETYSQQQQQHVEQQQKHMQERQQGIPPSSTDAIAYVTTRDTADHKCGPKPSNAIATPTNSSNSCDTCAEVPRGRIIAEYQHDLSHVLPGVGVTVRVREPLLPGLVLAGAHSSGQEALLPGPAGSGRTQEETSKQYIVRQPGSTLGSYSKSCFNPLFVDPCGEAQDPVQR
jgi:hypothetical protein